MTTPLHRTRRPGSHRRDIVAVVTVSLFVAAIVFYSRPLWLAKRTEQTLNDRYGYADAFIPSPDGGVAAERIEAFVRVRERVIEYCPSLQDMVVKLVQLDRLEQADSVRGTAGAPRGLGRLRELAGFGSTALRFIDARNKALLDEHMGLGEYEYIYVLAYAGQLRGVDHSAYAAVEEARVGSRARDELMQILAHQMDLLESGPLAAALDGQIARMRSGTQLLPWEDGLPPAIAASLEPYAARLAPLYCDGIARIELTQKNRGLDLRN